MIKVTMFAGADCAPCAALKQVLVGLCADLNVALSIITLTGPDDPAVHEHGLRTVPTVIVQYTGGATARFTGNKLRDYIESIITESNL